MKTQNATYPATCQTILGTGERGQSCAYQSVSVLPLYAPFILLLRWMLGWAFGESYMDGAQDDLGYRPRHHWRYMPRRHNRKERRSMNCKIATANNLRPFYSLIGHTETKAQFTEKVSRLCIIGRAILYGFRYWAKKRLSMTKLSPFFFRGWDVPMSAIHADGHWHAHAIPN